MPHSAPARRQQSSAKSRPTCASRANKSSIDCSGSRVLSAAGLVGCALLVLAIALALLLLPYNLRIRAARKAYGRIAPGTRRRLLAIVADGAGASPCHTVFVP